MPHKDSVSILTQGKLFVKFLSAEFIDTKSKVSFSGFIKIDLKTKFFAFFKIRKRESPFFYLQLFHGCRILSAVYLQHYFSGALVVI